MQIRFFIFLFFALFANTAFGQGPIYGWMMAKSPTQDADTSNVAIYYGTGNGNLTGRAHVVSFEHFAALIEAYISAGLSDGDKGDITVSGSGATWNIDANTIGDTELSPTTLSGFGITDGAQNGANTDINSVLLDNTGLQIKNGTKKLIIQPVEAITADRTLSIDMNNGSHELHMEGDLQVIGAGGAQVSGSNTGDQNLSGYAIDANVVHLTGDEAIGGEKTFNDSLRVDDYALFMGLSGGIGTKIEMLKDGILQFDQGTSATSRYQYYMKIKPLQQTDNNPNFNFTIASTDVLGTKNNEVAMIGWNVSPGGSQEDVDDSMLALAFENNYETGGQYYNEFHLLHTDLAGNVRRPMTLFLNKDNQYEWIGAFHMNRFEFRGPETSDLAFAEFRYDTTDQRSFMKLRGLNTGNGVQHLMDEDDNLYLLGNDGLIDPKLRVDGFDTISFMNGKVGFGTEIPYAQFTNKGNVGIYSTYSTNGGTPIGPSLYLGDDGYYNASFYDKAPGLSALYNAAQGVASDLAFYAFNGTRSEKMRLLENGNLGIGTASAQQTLHVAGTMRLTGSDGTANTPMGRDADGDVSAMTAGAGISYTGGAIVNSGDTDGTDDVLLTTDQTVAGIKTFSSDPIIPDEVYDATAWNGSLEPATKNAVRDKIETLSSGGSAPSTISPSQITSDQDNYNPTGMGAATYVRISGDNGIRAITGIADSTAGTLEKTLLNIGSYPIYLPMDHPDSDAAHRFTGHNCDFVLYPGASVKILYDLTSTKWRIIGNSEIVRSKGVRYEYDAASVTFGELWNLSISAGGSSGTITATNATSTHSAHSLLSTSTSTTGAYVMYMPKASSLFSYFGSAHIATESLVSIPVLSDGTQTFAFELKLSATPAGGYLEENNMFGIRYSHSINSGEWELFSQSNTGTETVADLNVAVTADVLYKLRIEVDKGNTEARAYINDSYVGRVTATMPNGTAISASVMLLKSAGTTARTVRIHNISASAIYP